MLLSEGTTIELISKETNHENEWVANVNGVHCKIKIDIIKSIDKFDQSEFMMSSHVSHEAKKKSRAIHGHQHISPGEEIPTVVRRELEFEKEMLQEELNNIDVELSLLKKAYRETYKNSNTVFAKDVHAELSELDIMKYPFRRAHKRVTIINEEGNNQIMDADENDIEFDTDIGCIRPRRKFKITWLLAPDFNLNAVSNDDLLAIEQKDFLPVFEKDEYYLILLTMHMFIKLGLVEVFSIPLVNLYRFLVTVFRKYRDVPFHNYIHAFTVTQTCFYFLRTSNVGKFLEQTDLLAMIVSALGHDLDHPGLTNNFQKNAKTEVAMLHPSSILENHHLWNCLNILSMPECNILINCTPSDKASIEKRLGHLILSTDLAVHKFTLQSIDKRKKFLRKVLKKDQIESPLSEEDRVILTSCLMKSADLSNEIREHSLAKRFANNIMREFFEQSDREASLNYKQHIDKTTFILSLEQKNFITFLSLPLYERLVYILPGLNETIDTMRQNLEIWEERYQSWGVENPAQISTAWGTEQVKGQKDLSSTLGKNASVPHSTTS
eukprot:TRINITY_DN5711_c0_g1_i1.p1 TRINITY_DN5711_c0_g1~~TRINITY_DN5711_c0_g1_i1.p1  ORF type:complete len:561 (-),score=122.21 TRINITY_DN5711_c0_g1_i1:17-1672(-)